MSQKILGIDLGTGSVGISLRNPDIQGKITEQLEYFSVDEFKSGGSYTADRTKSRQVRRLYDTRRRRLWETLKLLIENNLCPLSMESLNKWMKYDKTRGGYSHQYPIEDTFFENWIKLDFNNDGKPKFKSPYHLRKYLAQGNNQIDLNNQENRYMLGRALYHIAQRRGFKSSKDNKDNTEDRTETEIAEGQITLSEELKESELKKNRKLTEYMQQNNCATVACAFADLIDKGVRIRASEYEAVRSDYKKEILTIFNVQKQLSVDSELYKRLISEKKNEGTIFYKKSHKKGEVGKCTLEPAKPRCPISHPVYEEFRALSLINNIRYKTKSNSDWISLTSQQVAELYRKLFTARVKKTFKFQEIREYLQKELNISLSKEGGTINYSDSVTVAGCPITARLISLLGEEWQTFSLTGMKQRQNQAKENKTFHEVKYTAESIWNFCYCAEEPEDIERFSIECLGWKERQTKKLMRLWDDIQRGYAMLSMKAMRNINRFLRYGLKYSDAVLLAKVPDILAKHGYLVSEDKIQSIINNFINDISIKSINGKTYAMIANSLISKYKALDYTERYDDRLNDYTLQESDFKDVRNKCKDHFGDKVWSHKSEEEKETIVQEVADRYQSFFFDVNRDYIKLPRLSDDLYSYLCHICKTLTEKDKEKLYHPSMISMYRPISSEKNTTMLLGSPNMGSIKNPVALRTLNILRAKINEMLEKHLIAPEDTRIVVETTRRKDDILDDANVRKAFAHYQTERQNERETIKNIIAQYYPSRNREEDIDKALYVIEQHKNEHWEDTYLRNNGKRKGEFDKTYSKYIQKYDLWLKQDCCCIYTGRPINIHNLFDDNFTDIEHTIPRSLSFDSSDANLTVCDAYYNRHIKQNRIPTQLENYDKTAVINGQTYTAIKPRLQKWEDRVKHLEDMVNYWKSRAIMATTKEDKDFCIVNKHEWQMELNYWNDKLDRFTRTDIPDGFKKSQLVDTGVITRHALAYLKSVFTNVVAEKGSVTADFRKILGVQSIEDKKDRSKHSHHAIDATILTIIPIAGLREEILFLYYKKEENKKLGNNDVAQYYERQLEEKIKQLNLGGGFSKINEFIDSNILINHRGNDRALQNAKRRIKSKEKCFGENGSVRTIQKQIATGDSIRLEISAAGNLGAILLPNQDEKGKFLKINGKFQYSKDDNEQWQYTMVQRVDIKSFEKVEDLEKIIDPIVRQSILTTIELAKKSEPKKSVSSIISGGIWIRAKEGKGDEIKVDKHGNKLSPIRHVRCKVAAGRGFLKFDSAIPLREQKYTSPKPLIHITDRNHKKYVYAQSTGNYLCLIYEGIYKSNIHREFVFISNYETAKLKHYYKHTDGVEINTFEQLQFKLMQDPNFQTRSFKSRGKDIECKLTAIVRSGYRVLKWNDSPDELYELSKEELLKRLYVVIKFNATGSNLIYLQHHLIANSNNLEKITSNKFHCLIEHRDFEIELTEQGDTILFK